jgi:multidrug efflux pump subunit AcrA (membrane-fusion protein)
VITTGDIVTMTANVDELDILSLEEGQEASIVLDALPDETISGVVTKVSETGTSQAGVTTYPVTVRLDIPEGMTVKSGMNASATIVTGASENTLMIPLAALQEAGGEKFVMVGTEGAPGGEDTAAQPGVSAAEGERRTVETGLSDGDSVEVLSGLEEGETVVYVQPAGEDGGEASGMEMMFGNGGGMPGGGNMPSGGGMGGPPQ